MKSKLPFAMAAFVLAVSPQLGLAALRAPLPDFKSKQDLRKANLQSESGTVSVDRTDSFFTGKPFDESREGYLFRYRCYDPELSRWATCDPSGFPDGGNNQIYIDNQVVECIDPDGLEKVKVTHEVHMHDPDCFGWDDAKGDGSDWITWYSGSKGFNEYLNGLTPNPTAASLATQFIGGQLGLTISGSSTSWTAYGGTITWDIYKDTDVIPNKTVWYFDFTVDSLTSYTKSPGHAASNPKSFQPIHASGELTSVTE